MLQSDRCGMRTKQWKANASGCISGSVQMTRRSRASVTRSSRPLSTANGGLLRSSSITESAAPKGVTSEPDLIRLLKAVVRREIDVVAVWSVDRLGRSLQHLVGFLEELDGAGCDLYLHQQALDTTTPAGRAMFQMLGVFSEFERSIIRSRVKAGMARARIHGTKSGKPIGQQPLVWHKVEQIRAELAKGTGIIKTARLCGTGVSAVQRIKRETPAGPP